MLDEGTPLFIQIARKVETDVLTGALGPDEQVPSTNEFASFYKVNPATVGKAFHDLMDRGILYKRRGIGMFVESHARELIEKKRRQRFVDDVVAPLVSEASAIGIPIDEVISAIEQVAESEEYQHGR